MQTCRQSAASREDTQAGRTWKVEARVCGGKHSATDLSSASRGPPPTWRCSETGINATDRDHFSRKSSHSLRRCCITTRDRLGPLSKSFQQGSEALEIMPVESQARPARRVARIQREQSAAGLFALIVFILGKVALTSAQNAPFQPVWQWRDPGLFEKYNIKWPVEMPQGEHKVCVNVCT